MSNKIKYFPLIFFFILGIVLFFPYLFQNKVPFPTSYIANNLGPWNKYLPNGPVKNGIPDVPAEIFPLRNLAVNMWKEGIVPLWNPYSFSGTPLLANFQSAVFFPLNFLFFFFPQLDAWSLLTLFQPLLAGIFTYLLLRNFSLSKISSLFGAVSFMFCGYLTVWGTYNTIGYAIVILPLVLLIIEKFLAQKKIIYLPFLTLILAFSFFSGHIQTWIYAVLAVGIYSLTKTIFIDQEKKFLSFSLIILSSILTIPLVAIQLLPTWELYQYSGRLLVKNAYEGIPLNYFITLIAPDFFGNPVTRNSWYGNYPEWSGYIGQIALLFSLFSFTLLRKDKKIIPLVFIGLCGFFLSVKSPFLTLFSSLPVPIIGNSNPSRALVLLSFSLACLSGFGLNHFIKNKDNFPKKILIIITFLGGLLLTLILIAFYGRIIFPLTIGDNLKIISLRNLFLPTIFFLLASFSIFLAYKNITIKKVLPVLLLFILTLEMLRFYFKWQPYDNRDLFYKNTKVTDFLKTQKDHFRLYGFSQTPSLMEKIYGLEGYEPLNLLDYSQFIYAVKNGLADKSYHLYVNLENREKYSKKILDLLGVKYFIYQSGDIGNPFKFPIWEYHGVGYQEIFNDNKFIIYQNPDAFPKVATYASYRIIPERDKLLYQMLTSNTDMTKTLYLEKKPNISNINLGLGEVRIIKYSPNEIIINSKSNKPTLLFLNDIYYPGWQAYINGQKTEVLRANYVFRGLAIPKGENTIRFVYYPNSYKIGKTSTIITAFLVLFILLYTKKKKTTI